VRWLLDEMLAPATAEHLRQLGHDAVAVRDVGLAGADDLTVFAFAVSEQRVAVTENFADYAAILETRLSREEPCVGAVFVRKSDFPSGGGLATHLAAHLDKWAAANPDPYPGGHWP
jgi:hypothetical protein